MLIELREIDRENRGKTEEPSIKTEEPCNKNREKQRKNGKKQETGQNQTRVKSKHGRGAAVARKMGLDLGYVAMNYWACSFFNRGPVKTIIIIIIIIIF